MTVTTEATQWPDMMTIPEVAAVLRVSKMTVYRMVHARKFDYRGEDGAVTAGALQVGRSFRVMAAAVDAYLKGAAVSA